MSGPEDPGVVPIRSPSMSAPLSAFVSPRRGAIPRAAALAAVIALAAAACSKKAVPFEGIAHSSGPPARMEPQAQLVAVDAPPAAPIGAGGAGPAAGKPAGGQPVDPVSYLAYSYALGLEVPGERLIGLMDGHAAACRSAGLRVCQVVGSSRHGDPDARLGGSLSLRAEPEWLQRFMQGAQRDAVGADGRVTRQSTSTEDLTRSIIDTEATLRAKRGLRDRLQQLLATRPGSLADLLAVERELARVQGELDSTESNLTAMRTRVSMSALTIEYESTARAVAGSTLEPLRLALIGFLDTLIESTAALVEVVGGLLPWVLAIWLLVWLLLRFRRRRASRRAARADAAAVPQPPAAA
jgi:hypothetical protein